jgi:hypothetical protein
MGLVTLNFNIASEGMGWLFDVMVDHGAFPSHMGVRDLHG